MKKASTTASKDRGAEAAAAAALAAFAALLLALEVELLPASYSAFSSITAAYIAAQRKMNSICVRRMMHN